MSKISVRPKQIRFRFSAEFRPFWPNFGFAETVKPLSVSVSVSAETKNYFGFGYLPNSAQRMRPKATLMEVITLEIYL